MMVGWGRDYGIQIRGTSYISLRHHIISGDETILRGNLARDCEETAVLVHIRSCQWQRGKKMEGQKHLPTARSKVDEAARYTEAVRRRTAESSSREHTTRSTLLKEIFHIGSVQHSSKECLQLPCL